VQDFFGLIEEMRVWRVVRTPEQIRQGMIADDGRGAGADFNHPGIDKDHKGGKHTQRAAAHLGIVVFELFRTPDWHADVCLALGGLRCS
jgi:hypothetical protein